MSRDEASTESSSAPAVGAGEGRRAGREVALQVLYAIDLGETGPRDAQKLRLAKAAEAASRPPSGPRSMRSDGARGGDRAVAEEVERAPIEAAPLDPAETIGAAFDRVVEHFDVPKSAMDFARRLVGGVAASTVELDELVGRHARNWRVERMAAVDRNVLRLGAYELRQTETPVAVVIDEAVGLAHRFGSDSSPAFVNGVLDAVAKDSEGV